MDTPGGSGPGRIVIDVVSAVIEDAGRLLVTRRQPGVHLAGFWEFPGGKVDPGETQPEALEREILEELGVEIEIGDAVFDIAHAYPDRTVRLFFYRCAIRGTPRPLVGQEMRWVTREELAGLDFPPADAELIKRLAAPEGQ